MSNPRVEKIRGYLRQNKADAIFVSGKSNVRYLSGFTGDDCYLLISREKAFFLGDFRYQTQARQEVGPEFAIILPRHSLAETISSYSRTERLKNIVFEAKQLSVFQHHNLTQSLGAGIKLIPGIEVIEELRQIKSLDEVRAIRTAVKITKRALSSLKPSIRPGVREIDLKNQLELLLRSYGAQAMAFETIVASGPNAAMPHARVSSRKIRENEPVIIDVGVEYQGYKSDLTRTFFSGKMSQYVKYHKVVAKAQKDAISVIRPGIKADKLDRTARQVLDNSNLGKYFGHALGHGVGLEVHEKPIISGKSSQVLKPGMIFTIEPGIYIPDSGGIRIEDMVLVTKRGYEVL